MMAASLPTMRLWMSAVRKSYESPCSFGSAAASAWRAFNHRPNVDFKVFTRSATRVPFLGSNGLALLLVWLAV